MISTRSNGATKMGKPPPPVPPRPSKNTVAEALAKKTTIEKQITNEKLIANEKQIAKEKQIISEKRITSEKQIASDKKIENEKEFVKEKQISNEKLPKNEKRITFDGRIEKRVAPDVPAKPHVPMRTAPPPPVDRFNNKILKSQSYTSVVNSNPSNLERSISHDLKKTRTVIYDSSRDERKSEKIDESVILRRRSSKEDDDRTWSDALNDRNHVNTLIDEMFAEVLNNRCDDIEISVDRTMIKVTNDADVENPPTVEKPKATVLIIEDSTSEKNENSSGCTSNSSTNDRKQVKFDEKNHEFLINELQDMKKEQERILRRQRKPSKEIYEEAEAKIQHSDWIEVSDGQEVRLSSCQITIDERDPNKRGATSPGERDVDSVNGGDSTVDPLISRLRAMSDLHGLPPLPKSLSGFSFADGQHGTPSKRASLSSTSSSSAAGNATHLVYPPHPKANATNVNGNQSNLDSQLAILRREMYSLRQLDLSLLSQLWSLNESIQDFRQMLQDHEDRVLSPPSPSPTPSSGDDGDGEEYYTPSPMRFRPAPPPPALRRTSNSSSDNSSV